jgi:hypothetical protein
MTERHYVVSRSGTGWVYTHGTYRSSLFGSVGMAAEIARTAATRAHREGDDTRVMVDTGEGPRTLWRKVPVAAQAANTPG